MSELPNPEVVVLNAVLELQPPERAGYLDNACAGDAVLRGRVEALLKAHGQAEDFLESPHGGFELKRTALAAVSLTEKPGDKIGRYKLLQQIGEGGCGVVYMAEQEEPVRRRVALKIIKLGMDTKSVIARFEAERQALALMDHPNIAKVLDAGATETGRPYFVMELVRGIKITDYCDENKVSTADRLKLFIQVCQAIQHAHQKGVIHRDIKPSNILITVNDGVPVPKVIDFGIAKATQGRLTDKTLFTAFEQFIGTPAYMSPEQAVMTSLDIDTRSDIYSLGVLLYELLTGKTPFDQNELLQAGLDEMRRTIREIEPPKPSTRLSTMLDVERTTTAKHRQTESLKLIYLVRGDLDWIVMKSLEKDRARRYETANGLAADIQRHLTNDPVVASPPSKFYLFQKFVRRNRLVVSTACALIVCLLIGLGSAIWGFFQEHAARRAIEALHVKEHVELAKAQVIATIHNANLSFEQKKPDEAERLLNEIPPDAVEPDDTLANVCRNLAWRHVLHQEWDKAALNFSMLLRVDTKDTWNQRTLDIQNYGPVLVWQGETAKYEEYRQRTLDSFLDTTNPILAERISRLCLLLPADPPMMRKLDRLYQVVLEGQKPPVPMLDGDWQLFSAWRYLALELVDYRRGDFAKAATDARGAIVFQEDGPFAPREASAQAVLAMSYHQLHKDKEARSALAQARSITRNTIVSPADFSQVPLRSKMALYDTLFGQILTREAAALIYGDASDETNFTAAETGLGVYYLNDWDDGSKHLAEAIKSFRKAAEHGSILASDQLAELLATSSDPNIRDLPEAIKLYRKGAEQGWVDVQFTLADLLATNPDPKIRDLPEAIKWYRKAAEQGSVVAQNGLAWLLATCSDPKIRDGTNAVRYAEEAVAATRRRNWETLDTLAAAYAETGQFEKAVAVQKEAIALEANALTADATVKNNLEAHLKLYESGQPCRE